ncbi:MAG: MFS transporter [Chloroflexota bacterium]
MAYTENRTGNTTEKNVALFIAAISTFFTPFMLSAVNIAVPSIGREFAMDAIWLSWIPNSFLLASTIFLIPFGKVADIYGRKRIFTTGIIIFTLACLLQAFSNSALVFIIFRVMQGIGSSMIFTTAIAIVMSVFPPQERGKAIGITSASVYLGISLGPFIGGLLTDYFGWRSIFLVTVPLGISIITAVLWKLKGEWADEKKSRFDFPGAIIYGLGMLVLIYGISLLPELHSLWLIGAGIAGLLAFLWWETRAKSPMVQLSLFRHNRVLVFSNLAALFQYSATFSVIFLISLYLQYIKGLDPLHAGIVMISMPAVQAVFSPIAGRLSDRVEPRILASVGMSVGTVGLGLLTLLGQLTPLWFLIVSMVTLGLGVAFFASPNSNAVMSSVDHRYYGTASAILSTARQTGGIFSMGIVIITFALLIGRVEITPQYYAEFLRSLRVVFTIAAALSFTGIFLSLSRGSIR